MSKKHSEIFKLDTIHQYKAGISTAQLLAAHYCCG